ncbi:MAG: hypothetical protein Unbinned3205contig1001_32 [Prokaryotic dsDNA virus sp.]|nr:MAG: hypothetical protein Unbinned3205contig1001_32 [Prokaryotic dsDNA virus sp.]|tara:strand:+ start:1102 stop:1680 length:579 start_codon:yes stop_codon:yes gene_type:complete
MKKLKIKKLKRNPNNPRVIKDSKFEKLKASIKQFPKMMDLRPIVLDDSNVVIGGNMRLKACTDIGWTEVPTIVFSKKDWEENEMHLDVDLRKSYADRCNEFIIKDNAGFGEWDWDILANSYEEKDLDFWGLDVWQSEDIDYEPTLNPDTEYSDVTKEEIEKKAKQLAEQMVQELKNTEVICPNCQHEFNVQL